MSSSSATAEAGPLAEIVAAAVTTLPDDRRTTVAAFVRATLRRVPPDELGKARTSAVGRQLADAFRFVDERPAEEIAVRVLSPEVALDGDRAPGAVVQVSARDRSHLLSTVTAELEQRGLTLVRALHPILGVERDTRGRIIAIRAARDAADRESFLHLALGGDLDRAARRDLEEGLGRLLADVRAVTADRGAMRRRAEALASSLRDDPPPGVSPDDAAETAALLEWLVAGNLVLLGWREYRLERRDGDTLVRVVPDSGLGILRDERSSRFADPVSVEELPPDLARRVQDPGLLTVSRTNRRSTVHRRTRMDYIGVTDHHPDGTVAGESRLLGLFTRRARSAPAGATPVVRRRLATILEREDVVPGSHEHASLEALLQALPKDELLRADLDTLHAAAMALLDGEERATVRIACRPDPVTGTVSVLTTVPRERYGPAVRRGIEDLLADHYDAVRVDADVSLGEGATAVARFTVHVGGSVPEVAPAEVPEALEASIRRLTRRWDERVVERLTPESPGRGRHRASPDPDELALVGRLPDAYREAVPPDQALHDIRLLASVIDELSGVTVTLRPPRGGAEDPRLRLVAPRPLPLSDVVPVLESVGLRVLDEQPFALTGEGPTAVIHDLGVRTPAGTPLAVGADGPRIAEAVAAAWDGRCETDRLNALVLTAGLTWEQVAVLRAYRRLRGQLGTPYTPGYVNEALTHHPEVAAGLSRLFAARFDPDREGDPDAEDRHRGALLAACDRVERLDHDRILRGFVELVEATLRTNAYRDSTTVERPARRAPDGERTVRVPYLSLKLDARRLAQAPRPVPYREVFVYSPDVEGVHLRADRIARGGIRESDRRDDVRTEVLGLMKAQVLKNALIVPTGAKGGFVVRHRPDDPGEARAEVRRQYVTFIRGLLDVTDDLRDGEIAPPADVRRHDGDDPYLVVAADKGTAHLSDTANEVAADHGFWLDDAFASGGSRGYDHKELGITARGAWLAVRRHFEELGIDPDRQPVTVIGIGDMSGDVFGNAMLRSETIRLVAAFDHRDIFLDPDPTPGPALRERRRLFQRARTSWQDFDRDVISPGGGVFPRAAKRIELSHEIRTLLRIDAEALEPAALIRAILRAPADLLFAGGIGTFVKSSAETHEEVDDRSNDDLRVDADQLRVRVIGEGANLAITQGGRIEYARRGGRVNQDAIDNAAGVALSDREVNCKILLAQAARRGRLGPRGRNDLLREITEEVVDSVLADVDRQIRALGAEAARSPAHVEEYARVLAELEAEGMLDREATALPSEDDLAERSAAGAGLTRPELATLLAGTKQRLADRLADSSLPRQPALRPALRGYFPDRLAARFGELLDEHHLRSELIATVLANEIVDRMGVTFTSRVAAATGADVEDVAAAFWAAREVTDAARRWRDVESLDGLLPPERIRALTDEPEQAVVARLTRTYATDPAREDLGALIRRDRPVYTALREVVLELGTQRQRHARLTRVRTLMDDLVDRDLAVELAAAEDLALTADVARIRRDVDRDVDVTTVADTLLRIGHHTGVETLERLLRTEPAAGSGRWTRRERRGLIEDLWEARRRAVTAALADAGSGGVHGTVRRWLDDRAETLRRTHETLREVAGGHPQPVAALSVAARAVRDLLATS